MKASVGRGGKFDPDAEYMKAATDFERIQLVAMQKIILVKAAELRALREERSVLARRIGYRSMARARREEPMGPEPKTRRGAQ